MVFSYSIVSARTPARVHVLRTFLAVSFRVCKAVIWLALSTSVCQKEKKCTSRKFSKRFTQCGSVDVYRWQEALKPHERIWICLCLQIDSPKWVKQYESSMNWQNLGSMWIDSTESKKKYEKNRFDFIVISNDSWLVCSIWLLLMNREIKHTAEQISHKTFKFSIKAEWFLWFAQKLYRDRIVESRREWFVWV